MDISLVIGYLDMDRIVLSWSSLAVELYYGWQSKSKDQAMHSCDAFALRFELAWLYKCFGLKEQVE